MAKWKCTDDFFETAFCPYCGYDTEEPYGFAVKWLSECPKCGAKIETNKEA